MAERALNERIWVEYMPVEPTQVPAFEFRASKANWYGRGTEYVRIDAMESEIATLKARIEELEQKIQSWKAEEVLRDEREKRLVAASEKAAFLEGWCREVCAARDIQLPAILKD